MRTIKLWEHQPTRERLSKAELQQILTAASTVSVVQVLGEEHLYELRPGSRVGTIVLDDLRLLIRPKIDVRNVFFLLGFRAGLARWAEQPFPYEREEDLLSVIAWAFQAEVGRGLERGIVRGYVGRQEALATVRGRIDLIAQARIRQDRQLPLECRYDDYTEDIDLNRVVKAAHRRLGQVPGLDLEIRRRLEFRRRSFADVSDVEYPWGTLPHLEFTRLTTHWESAGRLAELILRSESLRDREGNVRGTAFTVDMNALFEKFMETVTSEVAAEEGWEFVPQAPRRLAAKIPMRPDLVLAYRGRDHAVGDAKYKPLDVVGWPHADLYQLLAYCAALGLPEGLLIYASPQAVESHVVERARIRLRITGIDLSLEPDALLRQARQAARALVEAASRHRSSFRREMAGAHPASGRPGVSPLGAGVERLPEQRGELRSNGTHMPEGDSPRLPYPPR